MKRTPSEGMIIFLVSAVQFVNILDFMMVMPMGPDFAVALGIPTSKLGYIGGSYTAAAAISGFLGSFFLDRFDRRKALAVAMMGLVFATALGGVATNLLTLIAARVAAGTFGGPASALALSIVADVIPPERRGKAMGTVMGAFSIASILGVPAGLELAKLGGWRAPFFGVAGLGLLIATLAIFSLPSLTGHLQKQLGDKEVSFFELLKRRKVILSYAMTASAMLAAFIIIPNISTYVQMNLHYPREQLGLLYFWGGIASFFAMRIVGQLVDRWGAFQVALLGTVAFVVTTYFGFAHFINGMPVAMIFVCFMVSQSFRNVAYNTATSKVPAPPERARYMSLQSAIQHIASAVGAFLSAEMLSELPSGALGGMENISYASIALAVTLPVFLKSIEH